MGIQSPGAYPGNSGPTGRPSAKIVVAVLGGALALGGAYFYLGARSPGAQPPARTVTFTVQGSAADVTWGPAGSELAGSVPMQKALPLADASYYAINAQLQGDGAVTCQISVDGQVISQASADGGYHIAMCEIFRGPGGGWVSANGG